MAEINTRIILRNDTATNWENSEVKLKAGEAAVEIVNGKAKLKIATADNQGFAAAPYVGGAEANVFQVTLAKDETDIEAAINKVVGSTELAVGDIAIVKAEIGEETGKFSYTSYVYEEVETDRFEWVAMDGNYSASNVYFKDNITLAGSYTSVGNVSLRDGTLSAKGKSLADVMQSIFTKELYPTADLPSLELSGGSNTSGEVGSSYTLPEVTLTVKDVGSYTYGPATGIVFQTGNLTLSQDGTTNRVSNTSDYGAAKTLKLTATDSATLYTDSAKSYKFVASGTYTQGAMPVTNLNNEYPTVRIASGTATAVNKDNGGQAYRTITRSGWRNYWYGFISTTEYSNITRNTSTNAVGDGTKTLIAGGSAISNKTLPTITAAAGDRMPVVVMPTSARKKVASASMPSSLNAPVTFTKLGTVNLEGYNGASAVSYDVWGYIADDMPVGADFSIVIANA